MGYADFFKDILSAIDGAYSSRRGEVGADATYDAYLSHEHGIDDDLLACMLACTGMPCARQCKFRQHSWCVTTTFGYLKEKARLRSSMLGVPIARDYA